MSFFDDAAPPADPEPPRYVQPEWMRVPAEHVPVQVAATRLLARTEVNAVLLHDLVVYPNGVAFKIRCVRHPQDETERGVLRNLLGPPGTTDGLQVGLEWSDGRRATNAHRPWAHDGSAPAAHLQTRGGSADDFVADQSFWAWPLPDAGDLRLIVAWPAKGITDQELLLSGDDLRAAAARSTEIWPGAGAPQPVG